MPDLVITYFSQKPYNPPVSPDIPEQREQQVEKPRDLLKRLGRKLKLSIKKSVSKTVQLIRTPVPLMSFRRGSNEVPELSDPEPLMGREWEEFRIESSSESSEMDSSQSIALKHLETIQEEQLVIPKPEVDAPVFGLSFERQVN